LQVEGKSDIQKIVTGVSVSERLFQKAVELKADAVMVHHGLFWLNTPHPLTLTGFLHRRVKLLLDNDINLFAYHLPLDAHPKIGNNALIAEALKLTDVSFIPAGKMKNPIAAVGNLETSCNVDAFIEEADRILGTNGLTLTFGKTTVGKIFILSGGGGSYYQDAVNSGADLMVTGELREDVVRASEESGIALYAAGHYNTEKWGIRALGEYLQETFGLETAFVDVPNPI